MTNHMMDGDLEYYLSLPFTLEIKEMNDELGHYYFGNYVELAGCESKGDTLEDLISNMSDAKRAWISVRYNRGEIIPEPQSVYSGQLMLHLPRSLHQQLAIKARQEGISMNQYIIYLLSKQP